MGLTQSLAVIAGMPAKLNSTASGLSEVQMRWRASEEEWSVKEVLSHIREAASVYDGRLRRIVAEDEPLMPDWDQEAAAGGYLDEDTALILPDYARKRLELIVFLRALPPVTWQRMGTHEGYAPKTLQGFAESVVRHELEHLSQLRRMRSLTLAASNK